MIVHGSLNSHDLVGHIEGSRLWSDSALYSAQNANISDIDGVGVYMV